MSVRLFYVDDSGANDTGFITYSWVELAVEDWRGCLRNWLDWRHRLFAAHQIAISYELHATKFLGARGNPTTDPAWNRDPRNRQLVVEDGLGVLSEMATITMGTVYRSHVAKRRYGIERGEVYFKMLEIIDARLRAAGDLGIVVMDGDGTDPAYRKAHRRLKLATRAIIEDPGFQPAHESQFVQIADLVAYVTYQHLLQHPAKEFTWPWYARYLAGHHSLGGYTEV